MPTPEVLLFIGLVLSLSQNLQNELRCTFQVQTYLSSGGASLYNECLPSGETAMFALQNFVFRGKYHVADQVLFMSRSKTPHPNV